MLQANQNHKYLHPGLKTRVYHVRSHRLCQVSVTCIKFVHVRMLRLFFFLVIPIDNRKGTGQMGHVPWL